jgi:hypothetical protein
MMNGDYGVAVHLFNAFFHRGDFDHRLARAMSATDVVFRLASQRVGPKGPAVPSVFVPGGAVGRSRCETITE